MGSDSGEDQVGGVMSLHDLTNILQRLEIMANLLAKKDFSEFSQQEIREDVERDLKRLQELFGQLSSGQ